VDPDDPHIDETRTVVDARGGFALVGRWIVRG
jgi:hypothetical protein